MSLESENRSRSILLLASLSLLLFFPLARVGDAWEPSPGVSRARDPANSCLPIVDDFLVNDDTTSRDQRCASVAVDGKGYFVVTWLDFRNNPQGGDVYAQRYDSLANPLGPNFKVNDFPDGYPPSVAMDDPGNFVITFQSDQGYDIYAQRYDSSGNRIGSNFRVNDVQEPVQWDPCIGMSSTGDFVIAWNDERYPNGDIFARGYDSAGSPWGPSFRVSDDPDSSLQWFPEMAMSKKGSFVVCWRDARFGVGEQDIYAQLYDSLGNPLGLNFKVNDDPPGVWQYNPACAMDARGNFVITWYDDRNWINCDIYAQRCDSLGNFLGSNFLVNDHPDSNVHVCPSVGMEDGGTFVIVWRDGRRDIDDIFAQRYHTDGGPWGLNYKVDSVFDSVAKRYPDVAADMRRICFAWEDTRRGMGYDIYAKVVDWDWSGVGVEERPTDQCPMTNVQLMQNVPNPFSKETRMAYSVRPVAETGNAISHKPLGIRLKVYDVRGRLVKTLVDGSKEPGAYASTWDGRDEGGEPVPSGVYFYRLNSADQTVTKKMVLLR